MIRNFLITLMIVTWSVNAWAEEFNYQANVEGMVCAFCAYNVGKTIGALPEVDAGSVNVDLASKLVDFNATSPVDFASVSAVFTESGFTLAKLEIVEGPTPQRTSYEESPVVIVDLEGTDTTRFEAVLEAIGAVASAQGMRLVIEAPEAAEIDLLKPILIGRKPAINVQFVSSNAASIHLSMYAVASGT